MIHSGPRREGAVGRATLRAAFAVGLLWLGCAEARAQSCEEAWFQRNNIDRQAGYCFTTPRTIRAFGNAGCRYDSIADVPLSARQRAVFAEIRAFEQSRGCEP